MDPQGEPNTTNPPGAARPLAGVSEAELDALFAGEREALVGGLPERIRAATTEAPPWLPAAERILTAVLLLGAVGGVGLTGWWFLARGVDSPAVMLRLGLGLLALVWATGLGLLARGVARWDRLLLAGLAGRRTAAAAGDALLVRLGAVGGVVLAVGILWP